jgi:hypothetical protein
MSKALGCEINDFYNNHFPPNHYCDELADTISAKFIEDPITKAYKLNLDPTEKYDLDLMGVIVHNDYDDYGDFEVFFKKWKKNCTYKSFHFTVERCNQEALDEIQSVLDKHRIKNLV